MLSDLLFHAVAFALFLGVGIFLGRVSMLERMDKVRQVNNVWRDCFEELQKLGGLVEALGEPKTPPYMAESLNTIIAILKTLPTPVNLPAIDDLRAHLKALDETIGALHVALISGQHNGNGKKRGRPPKQLQED